MVIFETVTWVDSLGLLSIVDDHDITSGPNGSDLQENLKL